MISRTNNIIYHCQTKLIRAFIVYLSINTVVVNSLNNTQSFKHNGRSHLPNNNIGETQIESVKSSGDEGQRLHPSHFKTTGLHTLPWKPSRVNDRDVTTRVMRKASTRDSATGLLLKTPDLIKLNKYPVEEHFAITPDGYVLGLHRIPGPRYSRPYQNNFNNNVVLLLHGLFGTSLSYLLNGPSNSLGFLLANAGYDVWLGNFRGNTYSRNHTILHPDQDIKFWHFSQDEMAEYDIPTMVNYIRSSTGVDKLFYIGYSQGTRVFYMSASTQNSIVDKIRLAVGMASTAYRRVNEGPQSKILRFLAKSWRLPETLGKGEIMRRNVRKYRLIHLLCNERSIFQRLCIKAVSSYFGTRVNLEESLLPKENLPFLLSSLNGGASVRQVAHFTQLNTNGRLHRFDFGAEENENLYGIKRAPNYDMGAVTCPTAVYWAPNDALTKEKDIQRLVKSLPNVISTYKVPNSHFNHFDFVASKYAKELVYDSILELMGRY